jgi:hypothetical protein
LKAADKEGAFRDELGLTALRPKSFSVKGFELRPRAWERLSHPPKRAVRHGNTLSSCSSTGW